ncbi:hypothetical protein OUZ56_015291 [Daphnia magna]|uniref:Uncharacterized protein n=1 Tax=Daphnia magna TaxID=35525 RepID=A0ABR0AMD8_9CRUS|nr:hypothetical protein OUZ56_015291 [Daphnia magna]
MEAMTFALLSGFSCFRKARERRPASPVSRFLLYFRSVPVMAVVKSDYGFFWLSLANSLHSIA